MKNFIIDNTYILVMIFVNSIFIRLYSSSILAYWFMSLYWKFYYCSMDIWLCFNQWIHRLISLRMDIHCDLFDKLIELMIWSQMSNRCDLSLSWIYRMIHDLLLKNLKNKHILIEFMNRVHECSVWFGLVDSKTLVLFFVYLLIFTFFLFLKK